MWRGWNKQTVVLTYRECIQVHDRFTAELGASSTLDYGEMRTTCAYVTSRPQSASTARRDILSTCVCLCVRDIEIMRTSLRALARQGVRDLSTCTLITYACVYVTPRLIHMRCTDQVGHGQGVRDLSSCTLLCMRVCT